MRLNIRHETTYTYATPATRAIETLRLTPRPHDGQFIVHWRLDVDRDCRLDQSTDPFGNPFHSFNVEGPIERLTIVAEGAVETQETNGVLGGQVERFPPLVFLRETSLTTADADVIAFASSIGAPGARGPLETLHALMGAIHQRLVFDADATGPGSNAAEALRQGHGVAPDFTHLFIACARHLGIPARYASGYVLPPEPMVQRSGHAWAEALVDGLGWIGFDAVHDVCPTEAYVRLAVGLDYLGAAPVRGMVYGGTGEVLDVRITVAASRGAR